jgi:[ribosomal protein S18]-alanine N-acetyltransferase
MQKVPWPVEPDLRPFSPHHETLVASWARSAQEALMWCGEQEFPVPAQWIANWQREDDVQAHLLVADDVTVGYGELWLDADEAEVELARIIIAPSARGQGLGRTLVRGLLSEAAKTGWSDVFVRVHPDNPAALRCYRGVGFVPVAAASAAEWNAVQPVDYVWLQYQHPSSS